MHEFDLSLNLKLLMKLRKIKSMKIIAIPMNYELEKEIPEIKKHLN